MNRRGFLGKMFAAAGAAIAGKVVAEKKPPIMLHDAAHHDLSKGFGLVPIKREGASIPFDDIKPGAWIEVEDVKSAIIPRSEFRQIMADTLNKAFDDHYSKDPGDFRELFDDEEA